MGCAKRQSPEPAQVTCCARSSRLRMKRGDLKAAPCKMRMFHWRSTRSCDAFALLLLLQQAVTAVVAAIQHVDQVRVAVGVGEEVVTQQVDLHQGLFLG